MNPSGMYEGGKKKRESSSKDLLPFSGKLLAEFDRRRSIKDMFRKQTTFIDENLVSSTVTAASEPTGSDTQLFIPVDSKDSTSQRTDNSAPSPKTQSSEASSNQRSNSSILQSNSSPYKKRKPNPTSKESNAPSNNQKTLKSFFLATQSKSDKTYHPSSTGTGTPSLSKADASPSKTGTRNHDSSLLSNDSPTPNRIMLDSLAQASESDDKALTSPAEEKFIDPEETRMEWTKIFSKRDPPRCEGHNEPCTNLETKKKGVNCGRRFWICPRSVIIRVLLLSIVCMRRQQKKSFRG
jgi:AP endonuclease-2